MSDTQFDFDKFMDDTLIKETKSLSRDPSDDELTPQRKRERARREKVNQLITYKKKEK